MQAHQGLFIPGQPSVPVILGTVGQHLTQQDLDQIRALFQQLNWGPDVHTVWITNGWHTGTEGRIHPVTGEYVMAQVTYCDYKLEYNGPIHHYYLN